MTAAPLHLAPIERDRLLALAARPLGEDGVSWPDVARALTGVADLLVRIDRATFDVGDIGDPDTVTHWTGDARDYLCDAMRALTPVLPVGEVQQIIARLSDAP